MSSSSKKNKSAPTDINTLASDAIAAIKNVAGTVPIDAVSPQQANADRVGNRVPDEAIALAATIVEANPKRFPDYDAAAMRAAITYEQAMRPLGVQVTAFGQQITRSVSKRKGDAAAQALSLYQTMKGLTRLSKTDPLAAQVSDMKKLLATTVRSRASNLTQAEEKATLKKAKAAKVANAKVADAVTVVADAAQVAGAAGVPVPTVVMASSSPSSGASTASVPVTPALAAVTPGH